MKQRSPHRTVLSSLTNTSNLWSTKQHLSSKTMHNSSTNLTTKRFITLYEHFTQRGYWLSSKISQLPQQSISTVRTETICDLIRMILTMNSFEFNNTFYIQTHGTAMETRMASSYANLFVAKFETDTLTNAPLQPQTWGRFINDDLDLHRRRTTHFYYLTQQHSSDYQIQFSSIPQMNRSLGST